MTLEELDADAPTPSAKAARASAPPLTLIFMSMMLAAAPAPAALRVVASVPDLGELARAIGGDRVKVEVLATGKEDLHAVPARPSFLPKLNRADLLLTLGLGAEHSWLDALAAESRNPRIAEGRPGRVDASRGVEVLGVPARLDRSHGEQHPGGNPHYNIDPASAPIMARNVAEALVRADPDHAAEYNRRLEAWLAAMEEVRAGLAEKGAPLQGLAVVEYHPDLAYLCRFYGMVLVGSIEARPGVPPSASHLSRLAQEARRKGVRLVIHNQSQDNRLPEKLAREIGAARVEIANAVGAKNGIATLADLHCHNLEALLRGLAPAAR